MTLFSVIRRVFYGMNGIVGLMLSVMVLTQSMSANAAEKVVVFAASSLTQVLQNIADKYRQQHPEVDIVPVYASSSTLARQIVQGAPAAIFISADLQWMDYLAQHQALVADSRQILLGNQLVLVAPKTSALTNITLTPKTDWLALLGAGRLAMGDPAHVPAGIYGQQALTFYGVWSQLAARIAPADSVRNALMLVSRDEVPLGIVYASDAQATSDVKVVATFPANTHKPIEYPMALINNHNSAAAQAFFFYLRTPPAQDVFKQYGFTTTP